MVQLAGISSRLPPDGSVGALIAGGFDDRRADPLERPRYPLLRPEGEAKYGRKNFMEILSVFTSPPLFHVTWGRKELGFVTSPRSSTSKTSRQSSCSQDDPGRRPIWIGGDELPTLSHPTKGASPGGWVRDSSLATRSVNLSGRFWQATYRSRTGPAEQPARWLNCESNSPGFAPVRLHSCGIRMLN